MRSRDEINESLLSRIMAQFNNLVDAKLDDDRKSSRAVFSNDFDALLAVNCLNGAIIANTVFTARLAADPVQLIPKTAGAEINCVTNRSVNEDKVNELSEIYFKEANYEYDDTSYETEDEQNPQEEDDLEEDDDDEDDDGDDEEEDNEDDDNEVIINFNISISISILFE
jgi:TATA-binding protein-associated factor Taf7